MSKCMLQNRRARWRKEAGCLNNEPRSDEDAFISLISKGCETLDTITDDNVNESGHAAANTDSFLETFCGTALAEWPFEGEATNYERGGVYTTRVSNLKLRYLTTFLQAYWIRILLLLLRRLPSFEVPQRTSSWPLNGLRRSRKSHPLPTYWQWR